MGGLDLGCKQGTDPFHKRRQAAGVCLAADRQCGQAAAGPCFLLQASQNSSLAALSLAPERVWGLFPL